MSTRHASLPRMGLTIALLAVFACSRSSPIAPDAPAVPSGASSMRSIGEPIATFPLTGDKFLLETAKSGVLSGTYRGVAQRRPDAETSTLRVDVSGGTGGFATAAGFLDGAGSGSFSVEGPASLTLEGTIAGLEGPDRLRINLKGHSSLSCENGQIRVTIAAEGTLSGVGRVNAVLSHLVGNTGCS